MSQILPSQDELLAHAAAEPAFAAWLQGHGPLQHSAETRAAVFRTAHQLVQAGLQPDLGSVYQLFRALDRLTASALRIVVHMTYARRIRLDGQPLQAEDFKTQPEGPHRRSPEHGPGLRRLSGTQRPDRQDSRLADGPGPLRGRHRRAERPHRQPAPGAGARLCRRRGRAEPLAAGLLRLRPGPQRRTGGATGQPRESAYRRRYRRGRLPRLRRIAVCAHAAARRDPGGVPLRWCRRGTARQRLDSALVASRGLRGGAAGDDRQWPAHRAAHRTGHP